MFVVLLMGRQLCDSQDVDRFIFPRSRFDKSELCEFNLAGTDTLKTAIAATTAHCTCEHPSVN
jgi:hypothetical protein